MGSILLIDDDLKLRNMVRDYLSEHGLHASGVGNTTEADAIFPTHPIRARARTGSGKWSCDIGADDYLVKLFSPRELLAHAQAQLRRACVLNGAPREILFG